MVNRLLSAASIFLLLFAVLEVFIFVQLGLHFGFLLTIVVMIVVSLVGIKLSKWLMFYNITRLQAELQEAAAGDPAALRDSALPQSFIPLSIFTMFLFIVPGVITDVLGIIILAVMFFNPQTVSNHKQMFAGVSSRWSKSRFAQHEFAKYGKSFSEQRKEEEEAERARQQEMYGDVPQPNERAGQATIAEMKAKFQENKKVENAQFEEVQDDDDKPKSV